MHQTLTSLPSLPRQGALHVTISKHKQATSSSLERGGSHHYFKKTVAFNLLRALSFIAQCQRPPFVFMDLSLSPRCYALCAIVRIGVGGSVFGGGQL